jgi:hypothetical protein
VSVAWRTAHRQGCIGDLVGRTGRLADRPHGQGCVGVPVCHADRVADRPHSQGRIGRLIGNVYLLASRFGSLIRRIDLLDVGKWGRTQSAQAFIAGHRVQPRAQLWGFS